MNEYQRAALTTAQYPESGTGSIMALAYVALGMGEAGEFQNKVKKILRDSGGDISNDVRAQLLEELGDIQWYVAVAAAELGSDLADVAQMNVEKLADRQERGVLGGSGDRR